MPRRSQVDIWALSDLCTPWCVHVVATLRIADHIATGITQIDDLAAASGSDSDSLHRVLRHLVGQGVFEEPAPGRFALNQPAHGLLDSATRPGLDLGGIGGRMAYAWGSLLGAVPCGPARRPITRSSTVLSGRTCRPILRARPEVRGTLVDLPPTVARSVEIFQVAGVAKRVTAVGPSCFDPLPAGADLYLMKNVLGDWPDREAMAILRRCAEAARPAGRIAVLGGVSPDEDRGPSPSLLMMVLVGGRDRSLAEFRELARAAGLDVQAAGRQPSGRLVIECRPIS